MKLSIILLAILTLYACGDDGGSSNGISSAAPATVTPPAVAPPTVAAQSVGGIWRGQLTTASGATVAGIMVSTEDGRFFTSAENPADSCADVRMGTLTVSGTDLAGDGDIVILDYTTIPAVQIDCTFSDSSTWATSTISASIVPLSTYTLTATDTTDNGTALPGVMLVMNYDSLYNESSDLAKISGSWTGQTGALTSIDSNGVLSSLDATTGCMLTGQVSIINAAYNAYSLSATYSGCQAGSSSINGLAATGLIALNDMVTPNQLYVEYSLTLTTGDVFSVYDEATR